MCGCEAVCLYIASSSKYKVSQLGGDVHVQGDMKKYHQKKIMALQFLFYCEIGMALQLNKAMMPAACCKTDSLHA